MNPRIANVIAIVAILLELASVAYVAFFAYLGSAWFADDSWASRATSTDWMKAGLLRLGVCLIVGSVAGVGTWQINRWLLTRGAKVPHALPKLSGGIAAIVIIAASAIGSIQFMVQRPWL